MDRREEALARLRSLPDTVRPGRSYVAVAFRPEDAPGVAALFYRVYGESYPLDLYYDPEALRQAVDRGALHPVTARLPDGEIVGFTALYASSPLFPGLMEFGLGMVHPAYRGSFVLFHLHQAMMERMDALPEVQAVFGEAVCDTVITQHSTSLFGFKECALELDLMPGSGDGRIACLVMFRNTCDRRRRMFAPPEYAPEIERITAWTGLDREMVLARDPEPGATRLHTQMVAQAGLLRASVLEIGPDYREALGAAEQEALDAGCRRFQWFLNLADPASALAAAALRGRGCGFGGLVPRWFDDDALLLYRLLDPPALSGIHLYSDQARELLAMVRPGPEAA